MNAKIEPKKTYISPYLASLPSLSLQLKNIKAKTRNTSLNGSPIPHDARKNSLSQTTRINFDPNSQSSGRVSSGYQKKPTLSRGNIEKLQIAMKQLSFDTNNNVNLKATIGGNKTQKKNSSELLNMSARSSKVEANKSVKKKSKSQRSGITTAPKEKEQASNNDPSYSGLVSNIPMGDTLSPPVKAPVKSILKDPSKGQFGKHSWKKLFFNAADAGESWEKTTVGHNYANQTKKRNVNFGEKVLIHYIPYENRGSTEWQHNLMMARENAFQNMMINPRLNSLISDLGLQSNPFTGSSDNVVNNLPHSRLFRRQKFF